MRAWTCHENLKMENNDGFKLTQVSTETGHKVGRGDQIDAGFEDLQDELETTANFLLAHLRHGADFLQARERKQKISWPGGCLPYASFRVREVSTTSLTGASIDYRGEDRKK